MSELIDRLVEAYNAHNAEDFASLFAEDGRALEYPGIVAQQGRAAIEAYYRARFAQLPGLRTQVMHRIDLGHRILDHEEVDRGDGTSFQCVAIYEIDGKEILTLEIVRERH